MSVGMDVIALAILKATVIVTLALAATSLARHTRAAIRHAMLTIAIAALLALPVAMAILPGVPVTLPGAPTVRTVATLFPVSWDDVSVVPSGASRWTGARSSATVPDVSFEAIIVAIWAVGALFALVPLAVGAVELRRIRRQATRFHEAEILLRDLAQELGVTTPTAVAIHAELAGPMTCGVRNPVVIFPADAPLWNVSDVQRAMRHELEHVRRADCLIDGLARVTCAIYWCHPLVWTTWRRLRLEAERACDDAVLRTGDPIGYADQLVTLAARVSVSRAPLVAMAGHGDLARRVTAVLDRAQRRGRASRASIAGLVAVGLALLGAIAPVRASRQASQAGAAAFEIVSVKENTSGDPFGGGDRLNSRIYPGGRFTARNMTLHDLVLLAYRWEITRSQLTGISPWMDQRRFDIDAKAADGAVAAGEIDVPRAQLMDGMLQTLLADRFKLRVRREQRTGDVLVLSVAPGGPKLALAKDAPCQAGNPGASRSATISRGAAIGSGASAGPASKVSPSTRPTSRWRSICISVGRSSIARG
jgi:uncharacterized protein (TIGR03435 family)